MCSRGNDHARQAQGTKFITNGSFKLPNANGLVSLGLSPVSALQSPFCFGLRLAPAKAVPSTAVSPRDPRSVLRTARVTRTEGAGSNANEC